MKKDKIIIGCIGAVIILILASFSSVVGFQNTKLNITPVSPLFNIRSKRAVNVENQNTLKCDYVGKGKESILSFPTMKERTRLVIDKIRKMNSKIFEMFKIFVIKLARKDINIKNKDIGELIDELNQLREKPEMLKYANSSYTNIPFLCALFELLSFLFILLLSILQNLNTSCTPTICTEMCAPTCPPDWTCEPEYCFS